MAAARRVARAGIILAASAAVTLCTWGATRLTAAPADRSEATAPGGVVHPTEPTAEIIETGCKGVSLLFRCEPDARTGELSVLVRVPDTGVVEMEIGSVEPATLRADDHITVSEPAVMRRMVRRVAALGDKNQYALALYTLASGHRFSWTTEDWAAVLNKLDDCDVTVEVWLEGIET